MYESIGAICFKRNCLLFILVTCHIPVVMNVIYVLLNIDFVNASARMQCVGQKIKFLILLVSLCSLIAKMASLCDLSVGMPLRPQFNS